MELFAVRDIVYFQSGGSSREHSILSPPMILTKGNASTIAAALERASPLLSWGSLSSHFGNCREGDLYVVHEVPDGCKANRRKVLFSGLQSSENCLFCYILCCVHICHMILTEGSKEDKLVGDIHAIEFIAHIPHHYNKIVAAARAWLRQHISLKDGT